MQKKSPIASIKTMILAGTYVNIHNNRSIDIYAFTQSSFTIVRKLSDESVLLFANLLA